MNAFLKSCDILSAIDVPLIRILQLNNKTKI